MPKLIPKVNSIIVADEIRQETNGKWIIVGYYTDVKLEKRPSPRSLFIHAAITRLKKGKHEVSLVLRSLTEKKMLRLTGDKFDSPGPDEIIMYVAELVDFSFPYTGAYRFEINVNGEKRGETFVSVSFPLDEEADG